MIPYIQRGGRRAVTRAAVAVTLGISTLALGACSSITDSLLEAEDPDIINPGNLRTPSAAIAVRNGALERFRSITAGNESTWLFGGLLADEWGTSSTFVQNDETDKRGIEFNNSIITTMYRDLNRVRTATNQAITLLDEFYPDSAASKAEMYFARGFAEMQLAQDFCGAIPLSDASDGPIQFAGPSTTAEVFDKAIASYDSALALVGTATAGRAQAVAHAARIGKGRALIGNGLYAPAAAAVAGVPTSYVYLHTFAASSGSNTLWGQPASSLRYVVGDSLEGNARNLLVRNNLPFFSAKDPRVPASYKIAGKDTTKSQDGSSYARVTTLWARETPVDVVNGIDARLIEAEAALQADDPARMLTILNALRAGTHKLGTVEVKAGQLAPLALPATRDAQIDLLFREKAFWTFSRGQRLGDLRRLMRQYGRAADAVFPVGPHYRGGEYGQDVNLPIPQQEDSNPVFSENGGRAQCVNTKA